MPGSDRCAPHLRISHRPTLLTLETADRIAQVVAAGNYIETACTAAGIARRTFYEWWQRGDPTGTAPRDAPYRDFRVRIDRARAEGEARLVTLIARAAAESWQAAAWLLERQNPERWGRVSVRLRDEGAEPDPTTVTPEPDAGPFGEIDELARVRSRRTG